MKEFNPKEEITRTALKKMFSERHFSICDFDNIAKLNNLIIPEHLRRMLQPLHCINYSEMSTELRKWLYDTVLESFKFEGFVLSKVDRTQINPVMAEFVDVEPTGFKKMLGSLGVKA